MGQLPAICEERAESRHERATQLCRPPAARQQASSGRPHGSGTGGRALVVTGRHCGATGLHRCRPRWGGRAGHLSRSGAVPARTVSDDVHHPAVDHPAVRGVLDSPGIERVLPPQSRRRAEGPLGRVRPTDPSWVRLRPSAGRRGRRHGRGGDRLHLRHAAVVRAHRAGHHQCVHDDERCGVAGARAVHRGGRGAGRAGGEAGGHHPERHSQRIHGPQYLHLPADAVDADHLRHLLLHCRENAEVQLDFDLRLSHPGGRGHRRPGARVHVGRRTRVPPSRFGRRAGHRCLRTSAELLLGHRDELLHGDRQDARGAGNLGQVGRRARGQEPEIAVPADTFANIGLVADRAGPVQQRRQNLHRGDGRDPGAHPVAAHQRPGRSDRAADGLFRPDRPEHPAAAAAGIGHHRDHRSVGRVVLRRKTHPRLGGPCLAAHSGGRGCRRNGQGDRGRHPEDAYRGGRRPHPGADRLRHAGRYRGEPLPGRGRRTARGAEGRQPGSPGRRRSRNSSNCAGNAIRPPSSGHWPH